MVIDDHRVGQRDLFMEVVIQFVVEIKEVVMKLVVEIIDVVMKLVVEITTL